MVRVNYVAIDPEAYASVPVQPATSDDLSPRSGQRYPRDEYHNLLALEAELTDRYERDKATAPPVLEIGEVLERLGLRPADVDMGEEGEGRRSLLERVIIGELAKIVWGIDTTTLLRSLRPPRRGPRTAIFGSLRSMLEFWVTTPSPTLGMGEMHLDLAEDRPSDLRARASLTRSGRPRPLDEDGIQRPGFLPIEWMHAKQSRSGCTGGTRGLRTHDLLRHISTAASGLDADTIGLLLAADVGEWQPALKGGHELVRVRIGELALRLPRGDEKGAAHRLSKRLRRARWALAEAALVRGLIPAQALSRAASDIPEESTALEPTLPPQVVVQ